MRSYLTAAVRTAVQALIGLLISLPALASLGVDSQTVAGLEAFLTAVGVGIVTMILRWLEGKFPWLTPILSLGTTSNGPDYTGV